MQCDEQNYGIYSRHLFFRRLKVVQSHFDFSVSFYSLHLHHTYWQGAKRYIATSFPTQTMVFLSNKKSFTSILKTKTLLRVYHMRTNKNDPLSVWISGQPLMHTTGQKNRVLGEQSTFSSQTMLCHVLYLYPYISCE